MRFNVPAETLSKRVQLLSNVIESRQTKPILGNFLLEVMDQDRLVMTASDLELEIVIDVDLHGSGEKGAITVPAKKFTDICRSVDAATDLNVFQDQQFVKVNAGSSRFSLTTLPAVDFPKLETNDYPNEFRISLLHLKELMERTHFAMALQDVRSYLNGMLLEFEGGMVRAVATDAHRLALCEKDIEQVKGNGEKLQTILPRKAVIELVRLLDTVDCQVSLAFNENHLKVEVPGMKLTSKLLEGNFPDYQRVLPKGGKIAFLANRDELRQNLVRTSILASEKYKGVLMQMEEGNLRVYVSNSEQENAEAAMPIEYEGNAFEVGFNINYVLDVINAIKKDRLEFRFIDTASSCLVTEFETDYCQYVIMPMRV